MAPIAGFPSPLAGGGDISSFLMRFSQHPTMDKDDDEAHVSDKNGAPTYPVETIMMSDNPSAFPQTKYLPPADLKPAPNLLSPAPNEAKRDTSRAMQCYMMWNNFADYTTLHGFRQIAEDTEFLTRRIFWVIITTFGFALLMYQTGNSVNLYLSRPVAYNVKRNYYNTLQFPAITICNQNVFRITQAWGAQLYNFLENLYDDSSADKNSSTNGIDLSLVRVMDKMKHKKEDLILSCTWNRATKCYSSQLKKTSVDNSICYTFNGNVTNPMSTSLTGSNSGLNLLMNIEQYEFMRTRSLTAGIQLYIHNQDDLPREAISIPPGMKAYIRVNTKQVSLLSEPYGVCSSRSLKYFPKYTTAACLLECRETYLMSQCGCHSGILPHHVNKSIPICSIQQYSNCIVPCLAAYTPAIAKCNCPTECNFRRYNLFMSFSQISTFDVDQALKHLPESTNAKLIKAREVFYQVNADKRKQTINSTLIPFVKTAEYINQHLSVLLSKVNTVREEVSKLKNEIHHRFLYHKYIFSKMIYAVKNNWQRGWQVARERTFSLVAFDYLPLLYSIDLYESLHDNPNVSKEILANYQSMIDSRLYEKIQIAERALDNMTKIHNAFQNTSRLLYYKISPYRYYDTDFKPESIITVNAEDEMKYYNKFDTYTKQLIRNMEKMRNLIDQMRVDSHSMNMSEYHSGIKSARWYIEKRSRSFNYYLYLYEDRIVKESVNMINARSEHFISQNHTVYETFSKLAYKLSNLFSILNNLEGLYNRSGALIVDLSKNYIKQRNSLQYNLTKLSEFIVSSHGKSLESFASNLNSIDVYRLTLEQDMWMLEKALKESIDSVWDDSLVRPYTRLSRDFRTLCRVKATAHESLNVTDEQLKAADAGDLTNATYFEPMRKAAFYFAKKSRGDISCDNVLKVTNADWILEGKESVINRLKKNMKDMMKSVDLINQVTGKKEELALNVMNLKSFATRFREGNEISRKFVRDNFVEVQIYYQDLVSVDESQSPAYTMTQLWSDFGGNFGLLLGASALSVIEILDFFVHESIKMRR